MLNEILPTEKKEFYMMQLNVKTNDIVKFDSIKVVFKNIVLSDGDESITIKDRRIIYDFAYTEDGYCIKLFVLNEGKDIRQRIDYLYDEDFEIVNSHIDVFNEKTHEKFEYVIDNTIGEQVQKDVPIAIDEKTFDALKFIVSQEITDDKDKLKEIVTMVYDNISDDSELVDKINLIKNL